MAGWLAGAAWAFKTAFKGEVIKTVGFDLSAFDAGAANSGLGGPTVYAHELLARLADKRIVRQVEQEVVDRKSVV